MESSFYNHTRRQELLRKFSKEATPLFLTGVLSIYTNVKKNNKVSKLLLKEFQQSMVNVSLWSQEIIKNEHQRFINTFATFDKYVFNTLQTYKNTKNIVPTEFLHQCYLNIARRLWKQPFLIYDVGVSKIDVQKNVLKIEKIIGECITDTYDAFGNFDEFDELQYEEHINKPDTYQKDEEEDGTDNVEDYNVEEYIGQDVEAQECEIEEESKEHSGDESDEQDDKLNISNDLLPEENNQMIHDDSDDESEEISNETMIQQIDDENPLGDTFVPDTQENVDEEGVLSQSDEEDVNKLQIWDGEDEDFEVDEQVNVEKPIAQPAHEKIDLPNVVVNDNQVIVTKLDHNNEEMRLTQEEVHKEQAPEPQDIKLVTFDERSEKVRSLLNLKKKVKSSLVNKRTLYPSFF